MLAERTVANDDEPSLSAAIALRLHSAERVDERRQSVARIEPAEEENVGRVVADPRRRRRARMEHIGVDAVRNDLPVGVEVAIERDRRAVGDSDRGTEHLETLLKEAATDSVAERAVEVCVERADDRAIRFLDRQDGEDWRQWRVTVDNVVL